MGIALYVRDQLEYMKLCLGMNEELTETLLVRIKQMKELGNLIVVSATDYLVKQTK